MRIRKAVAICERLDSEEYSIDDKLLAVREVMNMPTHMGVVKDTLIGIIRWLWNFNLEVGEIHSGKRIVEIPTPHGRLIDADRLLRKCQKISTQAWKMKLHADVEITMNQFIDFVKQAPTIAISLLSIQRRMPSIKRTLEIRLAV